MCLVCLQLLNATSMFESHSKNAVLLDFGSCLRSSFLVLTVPSNMIIAKDCLQSASSDGDVFFVCLCLSFFFLLLELFEDLLDFVDFVLKLCDVEIDDSSLKLSGHSVSSGRD